MLHELQKPRILIHCHATTTMAVLIWMVAEVAALLRGRKNTIMNKSFQLVGKNVANRNNGMESIANEPQRKITLNSHLWPL